MQRRGFLLGLGAALAAPAVVRAESLMKIYVPKRFELPDLRHLIGEIQAFVGPDASVSYHMMSDTGWIKPVGQAILRAEYPKLFDTLGQLYGGYGDSVLLPDLRASYWDGKPSGSLERWNQHMPIPSKSHAA